jgi:hypothetical protein
VNPGGFPLFDQSNSFVEASLEAMTSRSILSPSETQEKIRTIHISLLQSSVYVDSFLTLLNCLDLSLPLIALAARSAVISSLVFFNTFSAKSPRLLAQAFSNPSKIHPTSSADRAFPSFLSSPDPPLPPIHVTSLKCRPRLNPSCPRDDVIIRILIYHKDRQRMVSSSSPYRPYSIQSAPNARFPRERIR